MLRTVLTLRALEGQRADIIRYYLREGVLGLSQDCHPLESELSIDVDDPDLVMVTSLWPSLENYRTWTQSPTRDRALAGMPGRVKAQTTCYRLIDRIDGDQTPGTPER